MRITICIGPTCYLKGSRKIIEQLQDLIRKNDLQDKIKFSGEFCMGNCKNAVCIKLENEMFSISPEETKSFFENEILRRV